MRYVGAVYKTIMPHANEIMKYFDDTVPSDYYDYLPEIQINNQNALLSSTYFSFLDAYFLRKLPVSETKDLSGFSRITKMEAYKLNQSKYELSDQIKELYQMSNFSRLIKYYSDSLAIDSLAKAFEVSNYRELVRVAGIRSRNEMQSLNLHRGDTIPDFTLTTTLDSLISIRDFSHQFLYVNFWATWCGPCLQNIPELNKLIAQYQNDPRVAFLNVCLESEHDKWLTTIEKYKIKGVNLFAEGNWNSKLRAYFNITGIPHYVIVAKHNILSVNATEKAPVVKEKIEAILSGDMVQ
jgi:thiol-disulfide isomerase/thioredoxin